MSPPKRQNLKKYEIKFSGKTILLSELSPSEHKELLENFLGIDPLFVDADKTRLTLKSILDKKTSKGKKGKNNFCEVTEEEKEYLDVMQKYSLDLNEVICLLKLYVMDEPAYCFHEKGGPVFYGSRNDFAVYLDPLEKFEKSGKKSKKQELDPDVQNLFI